MKLLLCRHAKSSWKDLTLNDVERPLNKRGKKDAPEMGKRLKNYGIVPDAIIASPANRAVSTARLLAKQLDFPVEMIQNHSPLYAATSQLLLQFLRSLDNSLQTILLVGHNPEFTLLANMLGSLRIDNVPTCGIVAFEFSEDSWQTIDWDKGKLLFFDFPKNTENQAT